MIPLSRVHPRFWPAVYSRLKFAKEVADIATDMADRWRCSSLLALWGDSTAPDRILSLAISAAEALVDYNRTVQVQKDLSRDSPGHQNFCDLVVAAKSTRGRPPERSMILAVYDRERRAWARWSSADRAFRAELSRQQHAVIRLTSGSSAA